MSANAKEGKEGKEGEEGKEGRKGTGEGDEACSPAAHPEAYLMEGSQRHSQA